MNYRQTIAFTKQFSVEAKNAAEANEKLQDWIRDTEFHGDVESDNSHYDFEDEDIDCPKCKGTGEINDTECDLCKGACSMPFGTTYKS